LPFDNFNFSVFKPKLPATTAAVGIEVPVNQCRNHLIGFIDRTIGEDDVQREVYNGWKLRTLKYLCVEVCLGLPAGDEVTVYFSRETTAMAGWLSCKRVTPYNTSDMDASYSVICHVVGGHKGGNSAT
jgi:hypothetical protein